MRQRSEEARTRIIEAAINLFSSRGYNKASVDDICAEAGMSKGAFYHHFKSKQELFLALLDGWLKNIENAIDASKELTAPETFMQMTQAFPYIFETFQYGTWRLVATSCMTSTANWSSGPAPSRWGHRVAV